MARYLRSLSVHYVTITKRFDIGKTLWSVSFWLWSCHTNVTTPSRLLRAFLLGTRTFFAREHKGTCTSHGCFDFGKVWTNSVTEFWKYSILKRICMGQKNIESKNVRPHSSITLLKMRPHYKTTTLILLYWTDTITPIWRILETLTDLYKIAHR